MNIDIDEIISLMLYCINWMKTITVTIAGITIDLITLGIGTLIVSTIIWIIRNFVGGEKKSD